MIVVPYLLSLTESQFAFFLRKRSRASGGFESICWQCHATVPEEKSWPTIENALFTYTKNILAHVNNIMLPLSSAFGDSIYNTNEVVKRDFFINLISLGFDLQTFLILMRSARVPGSVAERRRSNREVRLRMQTSKNGCTRDYFWVRVQCRK